MVWLLIFALSYLIGSIPSGYLVARSKGVDIRQRGSSNIGAANVARVMGKNWGYLVGLCDFLKGFLSTKLGFLIASHFLLSSVLGSVIAAIASILGHNYPVWLGFKGGKGVATYIGVLLGLAWPIALAFCLVWLAAAALTRYSSLAALVASAAAPVLLWITGARREALLFALLTALLWIMHRGNIVRLRQGTESRIGQSV